MVLHLSTYQKIKPVALSILILAVLLCIPSVLFTDSLPIATALSITTVTPNHGPISGGTNIVLAGDFNIPEPRVTFIASGAYHTCAIDTYGQVYCWGNNGNGQLGNNSYTSTPVAVAIDTSGVLNGKTVTQVSGGSYRTCALDTDGQVYCWGRSYAGQLGNNSATGSSIPVAVDTSGVLNGKTITQIAGGTDHACALDTDGHAYCWGNNVQGQLGNNSNTNSPIPVAVNTSGVLNGKVLTQIAGGASNTCALDADGQAYCWGYQASSSVPVAVDTSGVLNGKTITQIAIGDYHTCAIDTAGQAYCWGINSDGQLGNNSTTDSPIPVAVDTSGALRGKTLAQIAASASDTCAIDTDGHAYCWGSNFAGQLGDDSTTNSLVPIAIGATGVLNGKIITQISVSRDRTCALDSNAQVYCWGSNFTGQLGDNSTTNSSTPIRVHTISDGTTSSLPDSYLPPTITLDLNGMPAECINVNIAADGLSLTCTTTAHSTGRVDITINDGANVFTLRNAFEYVNIDVPDTGF